MESRRYFLIAAFILFAANAYAEPIVGDMHLYFPGSGEDFCQPGACGVVSGDYDASAGTLFFEPVSFFGMDLVTSSVELLPAGTSFRDDGFGGTYEVTVAPGQLGAYMTLTWGGVPSPTVMVWDITGDPTSPTFTPSDSDGDMSPGHALPLFHPIFGGITWIFGFGFGEPPPPPPGISVTLNVNGGTFQECTGADGNTVEITANVTLTGGAVLDSINWSVDGNPAGSGPVISPTLGVGSHTISASAITTTGESDNASTNVGIFDFTPPVLDVAFLDTRSGEPITVIDRPNVEWLQAQFVATDVCDPDPVTSAIGGFAVENGDLLKVQGNNNTVIMTTPELVLKATAIDASGNMSASSATLIIAD